MNVGLIHAYNESGNIGPAVESLHEIGCDRVIVVDGRWQGFGEPTDLYLSHDGTVAEAERAGADVILPPFVPFNDGGKRDWTLRALERYGLTTDDHIFLLDADERAVGKLDDTHADVTHACVMLTWDKPDDISDIRGVWPRGVYSEQPIPLLRWLRYSPELRCAKPGMYCENGEAIEPYFLSVFRRHVETNQSTILNHAYAAVRECEQHLPPELVCWLPILQGVEIRHVVQASEERVALKRRYYNGAHA